MKTRISDLTIEQFRSLRELGLERLGRVNLITGRNNTGKSSVLEALRILVSDASPAVLASILQYREEDVDEGEEGARAVETGGASQLVSLFTGFPQLFGTHKPILIAANGGERPVRLTIALGWLSEERDEEGIRKWVLNREQLLPEEEMTPGLVVESGGARRLLPLAYFRRFSPSGRFLRTQLLSEETHVPCVFVSPYGGEGTASLGPLWDKIALTDRERDVVEALRIVAPEVERVSMVGGEAPRRARTAIVRATSFPRPVPLRSFGDGLNRLFGIVLSLVNAKNGLLLIDEFENGMHHTIQLDVWRAIFRLSRDLNVQVFATSHSWDAVEAFQKAAADDPSEGLLIRLSRKGEAVIPTLFRDQELAVAAREHIEVR